MDGDLENSALLRFYSFWGSFFLFLSWRATALVAAGVDGFLMFPRLLERGGRTGVGGCHNREWGC